MTIPCPCCGQQANMELADVELLSYQDEMSLRGVLSNLYGYSESLDSAIDKLNDELSLAKEQEAVAINIMLRCSDCDCFLGGKQHDVVCDLSYQYKRWYNTYVGDATNLLNDRQNKKGE